MRNRLPIEGCVMSHPSHSYTTGMTVWLSIETDDLEMPLTPALEFYPLAPGGIGGAGGPLPPGHDGRLHDVWLHDYLNISP